MRLAERLHLLVVTDPRPLAGMEVVDAVAAALRGGATSIQLRDKQASARELVALCERLLVLTRAAGALLFVNDRVDVALATGADGVHLGEDDLPVAAARVLAPPGFLIGASVDTIELARSAERDGADYLGVGPVFGTATKSDAGDPIGLDRIAHIANAVTIPVVGIGGIEGHGAARVRAAGAAGVAVISAVMHAPDPEAAARRLSGRPI